MREIVGRIDAQGRWLSDFAGKNLDRNAGPWIDTQVFIINVRTLCDYLELAGR